MTLVRIIVVLLLLSAFAPAATPVAVDDAIRRGVRFLYEQQTKAGNWERVQKAPPTAQMGGGVDGGQWGGRTALCSYALLAAGERPLDPKIAKSVDWLRTAPITGTYALGLRANVWFYLPQTPANIASMHKDAGLLSRARSRNQSNQGFFTYQAGGFNIDLSCSQYGVLGCWAAAQRVKAFDQGFWAVMENAWHQQQNEDGGWSYTGRGGSTIQMTAAGVASLLITQDFAHLNDDNEPRRADAARVANADIDRGLAWIAQHLEQHLQNPMLYALYGIERVGVASGYKYIGNIDWYKAGADVLISLQRQDGSWGGDRLGDVEVDTAFALLFLSRGREPVMVNKLQFDITAPRSGVTKPTDWNLRPRDIANVTQWISERTERRLNWQIIKLSVASVDDLHDSNLLYITGKMPVSLKDEERDKLKQFIEEGGMIVASGEGGDRSFSKSVRALGEQMFPGEKFSILDHNDGHVLLTGQQFPVAAQKKPVSIEALGNGARLFMLLVPDGDLSTAFQKRDTNRAAAYQFFANVFLYSVEKTFTRIKGQTFIVRPDPSVVVEKALTIGRVQYDGRWDPEPGGWRRLTAVLHNENHLVAQTRSITLGTDSLNGVDIAHLTGTGALTLTATQRGAIKSYLDGGGLLLIDNCGGNAAFDAAIRSELTKLIPDADSQLLSALPAEHELFQAADGKLVTPQYRPFALAKLGPLARSFQLRALTIDGRIAVLYSPHDLSVGLVGQPIDGITGYAPETATALVRRIIEMRLAKKI